MSIETKEVIKAERVHDRLVYPDEVAKRLGIHPKTLQRFIREGRVPAPLKTRVGLGPCWRESTIDDYIRGLE